MSDNNIPFEIETEIIQRIPDTKSMIRCRTVSKEWKSVIDSKDFVTAHTLRHQAHNRHYLLIRTKDCKNCNSCTCDSCNYTRVKYYSIVDDDTFPHQKVSVLVPDSVRKFRDDSVKLLGGSHGLFCFYDKLGEGRDTGTAVIWNPCIKKTVAIAVPNVLGKWYYRTIVGFGVCPRNLDPKLVKISYVSELGRLQDVNANTQVEVFTLSSGGTWRRPLSSNVPHKSIEFGSSQALVDGFIYWDAAHYVGGGPRWRNPKLIMSFDLTTEEFAKVNLPDHLALNHAAYLSLSNLKESLTVLELKFNRGQICHVWQMIGHGCTRSFNKLYTFGAPIHNILGFQKSGAPIIEVDNDKEDHYRHERALAMYEPESQSITNIGIYGLHNTFFVRSYMETLLLLGYEIQDRDNYHIAKCAFD